MFFILLLIFTINITAQELIGPVGGGAYYYDFNSRNRDIIYIASGGLFVFDINAGLQNYFDTKFGNSFVEFVFTPPALDSTFFYANRIYGSFGYEGKEFFTIDRSISQRKFFISNPLNPAIIFKIANVDELWRSDNNGENWYLLNKFPEFIKGFDIPKADTSVIYLVTDNAVYRSNNSGSDWNFITYAPTPNKIMVNPYNPDSYIIGCVGGLLSSDSGKLDSLENLTPSYGMLHFIWNPLDTNEIYGEALVGTTHLFFKTTDKGKSWIDISNNGFPHLPGQQTGYGGMKYHPDSNNVMYVGTQFGLFKTMNSGESWFSAGMPYTSVFDLSVNKSDNNIVFSGQMGYGIMKSSDGGKSWHYPKFIPEKEFEPFHFFSFNPFNYSEGMLGGKTGVYKTTDTGDTWHLLNTPMEGAVSVTYHPYVENLVFASIMGGYSKTPGLYKSTDNGESWNYSASPTAINITFDPFDHSKFYITNVFQIARFNSYGEEWEFLSTDGLLKNEINNLLPITTIGVSYKNSNILYCGQRAIGKDRGGLSMSTDGGEHWFQIDSSLYGLDSRTSVSSVYLDPDRADRYYVGLRIQGDPWLNQVPPYSNGGLFLTEDDGKSWRKIFDGQIDVITSDNSSPRNLFIGTKYGIMKMADTFTVTSVMEKDVLVNDFKLFRNYPNPFNPATNFEFQIGEYGLVTLKVYDVLGREAAVIVNEEKTPGKYSIMWDASKYSSGVYLYKLSCNGKSVVKKMMLLK